ncbi:MAG: hypothetical protein RHS_6047 [Robinsoniella sp. RHS]|uniref:hypothetical protein n=1 Tax=Robinsoniella sp. RHS TaxID=1504536 RepID=UPI000659E12B|nr:MAG: hypothetical protein RHS_6047 [Robinsoniella sp. RHS]
MRKKQKIEVIVTFKSGSPDKCTEAMIRFFERNPYVGEPNCDTEDANKQVV